MEKEYLKKHVPDFAKDLEADYAKSDLKSECLFKLKCQSVIKF